MNLKLDGKTALVTGSTAGIGFAIAQALANEGASVIVNGRADKRVDAAVEKIRNSGAHGKLQGVVADLDTTGARGVIRVLSSTRHSGQQSGNLRTEAVRANY